MNIETPLQFLFSVASWLDHQKGLFCWSEWKTLKDRGTGRENVVRIKEKKNMWEHKWWWLENENLSLARTKRDGSWAGRAM